MIFRIHAARCQVQGTKYVRIYDDAHRAALRPGTGPLANTSTCSLECGEVGCGGETEIDMNRRTPPTGPLAHTTVARKVPFWEVWLSEGDGIYIPKGHWHYVRSLSPAISVNFWWT